MPKRDIHWPDTGTQCWCGDEFPTLSELRDHVYQWARVLRRGLLFKQSTVDPTMKVAQTPVPWHVVKMGYDPLTRHVRLECQCGWSETVDVITGKDTDVGQAALKHLRDEVDTLTKEAQ